MRPHPQLPLPLILALRAHLGRHRALSLFTILAIAASVTLATALEMSSRSVESELQRTARAVSGAAALEVVGGTAGVPEELVDELAAIPGVKVVAPFIQAAFRIDRPDSEGVSVQLVGIDLLADAHVRSYSATTGSGAQIADPLSLVAGTDSVLVARALAERLSLRIGDALPVRAGSERLTLTVRGVAAGGVGEAFGGQLAVMDVYALQHLLHRDGWVDRIDIVLADGVQGKAVQAAVSEALRERAIVRRAGALDGWLERALQTIRTIVLAMLVVATLVASLVSYSASSIFVDRRTSEIALLRAAGLEPRRVRRFLYLDAALLTIVGTVLGLTLGRVLSQHFLSGFSWIAEFLHGVEIERLETRASTFLVAAAVGGLVALAGVVAPARRAASGSALTPLLKLDAAGVGSGRWRFFPALVALAVLVGLVLFPSIPLFLRLGAALLGGLIAVWLATRWSLGWLLARTRALAEVVAPGTGRLAGASLSSRPAQTALAFVCVAGVTAGVTMSLTLVQSTVRSLDGRMAEHYPGGVVVMAGKIVGLSPEDLVSPETVRTIRATPGVRAVFEHISEKIWYRGEEVLLVAGDMTTFARFGRLAVVEGDAVAIAEAVARGEIVISDSFALHFGVSAGDSIELPTPKGFRTFRVAGVIRDYAGPAGSINMDLSVFEQLWPRHGSRDVVLWPEGNDPLPVISEIRRRVGDAQTLFFLHGDELRHFASGLLRKSQDIVTSVGALTAALGGLAVWNLMLAAVMGRARELALLLAVGATPRQVRELVLFDGALLGLVGGLAGMALGILGGYLMLTRFFMPAVGWSLQFFVGLGDVALLIGGVVAASLLASLYPSWLAPRTSVLRDLASD